MRNISAILLLSFIIFSCTGCKDAVTNKIHDTIIIGGGLMGSSTAWHLADQGKDVLLLEKQDAIYDQGSSLGEARIARSSNRGDDIWSYLHNASVAESLRLINFLQETDPSGSYDMSDLYTTSPVTYVGRTHIYDVLLASLIRQEVDYDMAINPAQGKTTYDVVLPDSVLLQREYNQNSGTLNPQKLIRYLHQAIRAKGHTVQYNTQVTNLVFDEISDVYHITIVDEKSGKANTLFAKKVVSAAGPFTGKLLRSVAPYFESLITPQRVFLAFLKIDKERYQSLSESQKEKLRSFYPVINSSKGTRDGSFFSMIEYYDEDGLPVIKIGGHFQRSDIEDLDTVWDIELSTSEIEWSLSSTAGYFELLNLPISEDEITYVNGYSCVYSLTKSEVPFVTPILNKDDTPNERCLVLGGMSGVGAKGAMTYGLITANLLNKKTSSDTLYNIVQQRLGFERLKSDLNK